MAASSPSGVRGQTSRRQRLAIDLTANTTLDTYGTDQISRFGNVVGSSHADSIRGDETVAILPISKPRELQSSSLPVSLDFADFRESRFPIERLIARPPPVMIASKINRREVVMISAAQARDAVEQYREEGYAVVRGFVDGDDLIRLQKESQAVYDEGLKHHATYRHGNLNFQILPEAQFGKRYVLQAYWFSWINRYFEEFRRNPDYLKLLEGLIGRDIKQIAQQLHWKPPGANVTGYRFHQDLRFRNQSEYD
ncbi:hypothetical protein AB4144_28500, partial [Rhizobiaceae sp. 2RAB30]